MSGAQLSIINLTNSIFRKKFDQALRDYDGNLKEELNELRSLNEQVKLDCVKVRITSGSVRAKHLTVQISERGEEQ